MSITITCPGCLKRFKVSDKFAGKKGPCPQCKTVIQIPTKEEDVVVHAPETKGPSGASGRPVLKPIEREESKVSPALIAIGAVVALAVLAVAWIMRSPDGDIAPPILWIGAIGIAPALVWLGYATFRDAELEPYRGRHLWTRIGICAAVYAGLWGVYALIVGYLFPGDTLEIYQLLFIVPPILIVGAVCAYACLDLQFSVALIHYGLYLAVTVMLRLVLGMNAF